MTISISKQSYDELLQQAEVDIPADPIDKLDVVWQYPDLFGQGKVRAIQLREGLLLEIFDCRLRDTVKIETSERQSNLQYHFHLSGHHQDYDTTVNNQEFAIYGSGCSPKQINNSPPQTALEVTISIEPETLLSFIGDNTEQLPKELQHLIRHSDRLRYVRVGKITPMLEAVLWQILRCPYQGMTKRIYLEGKALELMGLMMEQEAKIYQGKRSLKAPKSGTVDRIHYAHTILLQNISDPPSISELAKQVKLNEYTLKCGFCQVFNTTIYRYLHDYRLEQAQQLFSTGDMSVTEVMKAVGYRDRHHFAAVFRKKYQVNPRDYLMRYKHNF